MEPNPIADLDGYVEKALRSWDAPGLALVVVRDDDGEEFVPFGLNADNWPERSLTSNAGSRSSGG